MLSLRQEEVLVDRRGAANLEAKVVTTRIERKRYAIEALQYQRAIDDDANPDDVVAARVSPPHHDRRHARIELGEPLDAVATNHDRARVGGAYDEASPGRDPPVRLHEGLRPFGRGRTLIGRVCGRHGRRQPGECEEWRQEDGARNQRRQFRL